MQVKVFNRDDGATVVLPVGLQGSFPPHYHGELTELGDAKLDLDCLSPEFVLALGMKGYCVVSGTDAEAVLGCITEWIVPITDVD